MSFLLKLFPGLEPYLLAIKLALVASVLLGCFYAGWWLHGAVDATSTLNAQKHEVVQGNTVNAQDMAKATGNETRRNGQAQHDGKTAQAAAVAAAKPDYHTCQLKPEDMGLLNDAITGGDDAKSP